MSHVWHYCKWCGETLGDSEAGEGVHAFCLTKPEANRAALARRRRQHQEDNDLCNKPFAEQPAWLQRAKLEGRWEPNMDGPLELVVEGPDVDRPTENACASESSCSGANLLNPWVGIRGGFMLMNMCGHRHIERGS